MSGEIDITPGKILRPDEAINNEKLMQVLMGLQLRVARGSISSRELQDSLLKSLAGQEALEELEQLVASKASMEAVEDLEESKADRSEVADKASAEAVEALEENKADRALENTPNSSVKFRHLDQDILAQLRDSDLVIEGLWDSRAEVFPVDTSGAMDEYTPDVSAWRISATHTWAGVEYQATGRIIWNGGTTGTATDWDRIDASPSEIPDGVVGIEKFDPSVQKVMSLFILNDEWAFAIVDLHGRVGFGITLKGEVLTTSFSVKDIFRLGTMSFRDMPDSDWASAIVDPKGMVAHGVRRDGEIAGQTLSAESLRLGADTELTDMPDSAWGSAIMDPQGMVAHGVKSDGQVFPKVQGGGGDPDDPDGPVQVFRAYVEVYTDPSRDMVVTWHSDDENGRLMEYRIKGASQWLAAAGWTRDFPFRPEKIHSVVLNNLSPDSVYEFRIPGAKGVRKFRTTPNRLDRPLKLVWAADYQNYDFSASSRMGILGQHAREESPDMFLLGGDYVNDDGLRSQSNSTRWAGFIDGLEQHHADSDGCLLPMVVLAGNHEAEAGQAGKDNGYGYLEYLFSWGYDRVFPTTGGRGYGYFTIGKELLFIGMESDHATPWEDQVDWFVDTLDAHAEEKRHVVVACHAGPFDAGRNLSSYRSARIFRNRMWPLLQELPNCKFVLAGHQHVVLATPKLKMDYDSNLSDEDNDRRYYTDPDGIRQLGVGPWGGLLRPLQSFFEDLDSIIDQSSYVESAIGRNSIVGNVMDPDQEAFWHLWMLTLTDDSIKGECRNMTGTNYLEYQENV